MSYDPQQYYNAALAIIVGAGAGALVPPAAAVSPALRTRRLLALTLRDLRRLATGPLPDTPSDWESASMRGFRCCRTRRNRWSAHGWWRRFRWAAKLSVFAIARRFGSACELGAALEAMARGDSTDASEGLPGSTRLAGLRMRAGSAGQAAGARADPCDFGGAHSTCRLFRLQGRARDEVHRGQPVRRLCRADLVDDGRGLASS